MQLLSWPNNQSFCSTYVRPSQRCIEKSFAFELNGFYFWFLISIVNKLSSRARIWTRAAGWEARSRPLCYALRLGLQNSSVSKFQFLSNFLRNFLSSPIVPILTLWEAFNYFEFFAEVKLGNEKLQGRHNFQDSTVSPITLPLKFCRKPSRKWSNGEGKKKFRELSFNRKFPRVLFCRELWSF